MFIVEFERVKIKGKEWIAVRVFVDGSPHTLVGEKLYPGSAPGLELQDNYTFTALCFPHAKSS